MISDDLVNSYHLLLCALDLVLTNALLCNARKDLLNPNFKGAAVFHWIHLTADSLSNHSGFKHCPQISKQTWCVPNPPSCHCVQTFMQR